MPLAVDPPRARRGQLFELGQRRGTAFEGQIDETQKHLGGRLGVRQRAVARLHRDAEEVRQRPEARPLDPPTEQVPGERNRVDHGRRDPLPGHPLELPIDEADVEAGVVGDEHGLAGERHELPERLAHAGRRAQLGVGKPCEAAHLARQRDAGSDERLEEPVLPKPPDPDGADLADPRRRDREPRRLEVEDDEAGLVEPRILRIGERHVGAAPGQPVVEVDQGPEQGAGKALGRP